MGYQAHDLGYGAFFHNSKSLICRQSQNLPFPPIRFVGQARRRKGGWGAPPADLPAEVSTQAGPSQFRSDIFQQYVFFADHRPEY